ncbi:MAG: hypothetical protein QM523_06605, partial [Candidatus Pacebacteria bacterium]|nr:hypothetical protein [Candidatus Paceibacterota bacterium]
MTRRRNRNRNRAVSNEFDQNSPADIPQDIHGQMADVLSRIEADSPTDDSNSDPASQEPVVAPVYWDDEGKQIFATLPVAAQRKIAALDGQRNDQFAKHLQELAEERLTLSDHLNQLIEAAPLIDPLLKQELETDWEELQKSDPAAYDQRFPQFQSRSDSIKKAMAMRKELIEQAAAQQKVATQARLGESLPQWRDPSERQKLVSELGLHLPKWGYNPDDLDQVRDHRLVLMALDAMKYHQTQTDPKQIAAKKIAHLPRVMATAGLPAESPQAGLTAKKQAALRSGSLRQQADYILSLL